MSYRTIKRLIGETSLERKCRLLLGGAIVLLITASFWLYSWQPDPLAYDQMPTPARQQVVQYVERRPLESAASQAAMDDFRKDNWPDSLKPRLTDYNYRLLKTDAHKPEHKPDAEDL